MTSFEQQWLCTFRRACDLWQQVFSKSSTIWTHNIYKKCIGTIVVSIHQTKIESLHLVVSTEILHHNCQVRKTANLNVRVNCLTQNWQSTEQNMSGIRLRCLRHFTSVTNINRYQHHLCHMFSMHSLSRYQITHTSACMYHLISQTKLSPRHNERLCWKSDTIVGSTEAKFIVVCLRCFPVY